MTIIPLSRTASEPVVVCTAYRKHSTPEIVSTVYFLCRAHALCPFRNTRWLRTMCEVAPTVLCKIRHSNVFTLPSQRTPYQSRYHNCALCPTYPWAPGSRRDARKRKRSSQQYYDLFSLTIREEITHYVCVGRLNRVASLLNIHFSFRTRKGSWLGAEQIAARKKQNMANLVKWHRQFLWESRLTCFRYYPWRFPLVLHRPFILPCEVSTSYY